MDIKDWDRLEDLIRRACGERQCPYPVDEQSKNEIRGRVRRVLGIEPSWVPEISWRTVSEQAVAGVRVETLRFRSWPGVYGDASLWLPASSSVRLPVVLFHHGHAMECGRFYGNYQRMAALLASHGVGVLIHDVMGCGGRQQVGHRGCFSPFACGTTVCGLLVLEAVGLFEALCDDGRFDGERIGLMGHSGGGQNTIFLASELWDRVALAVCSGFASSFEAGARKERHLCECNLFPGILREFEIYHALGCLSPRPVMICSGANDSMVPRDIALGTGHRLASLWPESGLGFQEYHWNGAHDWDEEAMVTIADFILKGFGLPGCEPGTAVPAPFFPVARDLSAEPFPGDAIGMDILAERLTGRHGGQATCLADVFPLPVFLKQELAEAMPESLRDVFIQANVFADGRRRKEEGA